MKDEKRAAFRAAYVETLTEAVRKSPEAYAYPAEEAPEVAERIIDAMAQGGPLAINRNSKAFERACKRVGVKNTAKDLQAWFAV